MNTHAQIARLFVLSSLLHSGGSVLGQGTVFTTFGPGDGFNPFSGRGISWAFDEPGSSANVGHGVAARFTLGSQTYTLSSVTLALGNDLGNQSANNLSISLVVDNAGTPSGLVLENLAVHPTNIGNDPTPHLVSYLSSSNPLLPAGGSFWLIVEPVDHDVLTRDHNASFGWASGVGAGTYAFRLFDFASVGWSGWQIFDTSVMPAFRVEGTPVPEPGVGCLLAGGLVMVAFRRAFRLRRNAELVDRR